MVSRFGDMYDHLGDIFKIIITLLALHYVNPKLFFYLFPIYAVLFLCQLVHFGCQEQFYDEPESATLDLLIPLCPAKNLEDWMEYTRYFGCGTSMTYVFFVILFYGLVQHNIVKLK